MQALAFSISLHMDQALVNKNFKKIIFYPQNY